MLISIDTMLSLALLIVIAIACWLAWRSWAGRREASEWLEERGVPPDASTLAQDFVRDPRWPAAVSLADPETGLRGTVDHLLRARDGALVIGELKSVLRLPDRPHEKDEIQLGAYFLLCARDRTVGHEPAYGVLTYRERETDRIATFRVPNDQALRERVLRALAALRGIARLDDARRSHDHPGRCRGCGWAAYCEDRLG